MAAAAPNTEFLHDDTLVLASQSPRRRALLREAGWQVITRPPAVDDGVLSVDLGGPENAVLSLAWFKAAQLGIPTDAFVSVAADTVCFAHGRILGKPRNREEAKEMLQRLQAGEHRTLSGVCLVTADARRRFMVDTAKVKMGRLEPEEVEAYLDGGAWRDKAGGYNLADRQAAGWPIECDGDPGTVMGLPMRRLQPWLEEEREQFLRRREDP